MRAASLSQVTSVAWNDYGYAEIISREVERHRTREISQFLSMKVVPKNETDLASMRSTCDGRRNHVQTSWNIAHPLALFQRQRARSRERERERERTSRSEAQHAKFRDPKSLAQDTSAGKGG